jgi:TetR/AcrR family transcriptional regulator
MSAPAALPVRHGPRAERTRAAILAAAEPHFAERGFTAARLEDVALRVGIRRASLLYYFRDKEELYDAVLGELTGALFARVSAALRSDGRIVDRALRAVGAWVDFVGERPAFARILLREAADATAERPPRIARHAAPFYTLAADAFAEARERDPSAPLRIDPIQVASRIAGSTLFFVSAMPALAPALDFDPLAPAQLAAHRADVLRAARQLLEDES